MKNHNTQDEKFSDQPRIALPTQWSKPQLKVTVLREALSSNQGSTDAIGLAAYNS